MIEFLLTLLWLPAGMLAARVFLGGRYGVGEEGCTMNELDYGVQHSEEVAELRRQIAELKAKLAPFDYAASIGEVPAAGSLESAVYGWRTRALKAEKDCQRYLSEIASLRTQLVERGHNALLPEVE